MKKRKRQKSKSVEFAGIIRRSFRAWGVWAVCHSVYGCGNVCSVILMKLIFTKHMMKKKKPKRKGRVSKFAGSGFEVLGLGWFGSLWFQAVAVTEGVSEFKTYALRIEISVTWRGRAST